ncbi:MAG: hypothetical protein P4L96_09535 [Rhodoferax sp.]|nr:hypothetical protein [Rhodoferax sp.]
MEWLIPYNLEPDEPDVGEGRLPVEPKVDASNTPAAGAIGARPRLSAASERTGQPPILRIQECGRA